MINLDEIELNILRVLDKKIGTAREKLGSDETAQIRQWDETNGQLAGFLSAKEIVVAEFKKFREK